MLTLLQGKTTHKKTYILKRSLGQGKVSANLEGHFENLDGFDVLKFTCRRIIVRRHHQARQVNCKIIASI
jgi:hypothetical protein